CVSDVLSWMCPDVLVCVLSWMCPDVLVCVLSWMCPDVLVCVLSWMCPCSFVQMEDVKDELQERYKVLPGLNMRIETLEKHYEDMRERNRQLEQKLAAMQVCVYKINHKTKGVWVTCALLSDGVSALCRCMWMCVWVCLCVCLGLCVCVCVCVGERKRERERERE